MHTFDQDLFDNCPDNVDLFGYYQSPKYFNIFKMTSEKILRSQKNLNDTCDDVINTLKSDDVISLHIRRTDYVSNPNHPLQPYGVLWRQHCRNFQNFLLLCSLMIQSGVISRKFDDDRFAISYNAPDLDLCLMTKCKYHIIANSSFSWWGAWLAKSKKVFAPKNWFAASCKGQIC